jgi:hypothetical protein
MTKGLEKSLVLLILEGTESQAKLTILKSKAMCLEERKLHVSTNLYAFRVSSHVKDVKGILLANCMPLFMEDKQ